MRTGFYVHVAELQSSQVGVLDSMKGRAETFPKFGDWRISIKPKRNVISEVEAVVLYEIEGLYRQDLWDRFYGGKSIRLVVRGYMATPLTLKALALATPAHAARVLIVDAAKATTT